MVSLCLFGHVRGCRPVYSSCDYSPGLYPKDPKTNPIPLSLKSTDNRVLDNAK